MASSSFPSWQRDAEIMEIATDFILGGSRMTMDNDCSHEIKSHLVLGRKAIKNLHSIIKKLRHHFANNGP